MQISKQNTHTNKGAHFYDLLNNCWKTLIMVQSWGNSESTVFAMHMNDLNSIPSTTYCPRSPARSDF